MAARQSLASLLTRHEADLRRLYTSLGSPASVVDDKMEELHRALIGTVEKQRRDAEEEVANIKQELDSLKGELGKLASVLGTKLAADPLTESLVDVLANRRRALVTLNELKTERLSDFQTLYASFRHLEPILGETFFDNDLSIPFGKDASTLDHRNLTLVRQKALEKELSRCQEAVAQRTEQLAEQIADLGVLYDELEIEAPLESAPLFEPDGDSPVLPTQTNLHLVATLLEALDSERQAREERIQVVYDSLFALWNKLGVDDTYMEDFVETHAGISNECITAYEEEHARMIQVKNENMQLWIQNERRELKALKAELCCSSGFEVQNMDEDEDEIDFDNADAILEVIEHEKAQLLRELQSKRPILALISKYYNLLDEIKQLEQSANDPSRLTGKGVRGDPGRLLREEKQRKRIAKERPKLENDIQRLIPSWEVDHDQPFMFNGTRFLDDFHDRLAASAGGKKARSKTPAFARPPSAAPSTTSTVSNPTLKRSQPESRLPSPVKRARADLSTSLNGAVPAPQSTVPQTYGKSCAPSKIGQVKLGKATHKPRASFRPRPSSLSSLAPSSLFSSRAVSTMTQASSAISEIDEK